MTLSSYKEKKIIYKKRDGKKIKQIAREEKVCPETVRRCLERNFNQTGYRRNKTSKTKSFNQNEQNFLVAGDFSSTKAIFNDSNSIEKNKIRNSTNQSFNLANDCSKKSGVQPMKLDQISTLLENLIGQGDDVEKTLSDTNEFDKTLVFDKEMMKQVVHDIHTLQSQLAEVQRELRKIKENKD